MFDKIIPKDLVLLIARVLLVALFVLFGWQKITAFGSTTNYFASLGVPLPSLAASAAIVIELGVGPAIALGVRTRPLALLFAFYAVACGIITPTGACPELSKSTRRYTSTRMSGSREDFFCFV